MQIVELQVADITNVDGRSVFSGIRPGSYTVIFTLGDNSLTRSDVRVEAGASTAVETSVDWRLAFAETVTVNAASRRQERIVDAPAAVTMLTRQDIERQASAGQVPRTLAFTPGVELTQVSLNDFNLNTRGFNSAFNRRILTIIDGRDPSIPGLTGAQEWGGPLSPLDDLESIEFVRGPGAALYGAGAFNGVMVMTSKAPRDSLGGKLRVSFGELHTQRYELRHAGSIGGGWYLKVLGGYERSRDFTQSRVSSVEYEPELLPREAIAPPLDRYQSGFGSLRVDKYFDGDRVMTVEGGASTFEGTTNVSDLGRVQQTDVARPWIRFNLNAPRWNVLASRRAVPPTIRPCSARADRSSSTLSATPWRSKATGCSTAAGAARSAARTSGCSTPIPVIRKASTRSIRPSRMSAMLRYTARSTTTSRARWGASSRCAGTRARCTPHGGLHARRWSTRLRRGTR